MSQCNPITNDKDCSIIPYYLDITNNIQLSCAIIQLTSMLIIFVYFILVTFKNKIWKKLESDQKKIITIILSLLFSVCIFYFIADSLQILLYRKIYYEQKLRQDINTLKNIYTFFASIVPIVINNIYIFLCVLWQKILVKCNFSRGKKAFVYISIIAINYNIASLSLYITDALFNSKQEYPIYKTYWIIIISIMKVFTLLPAILIIYYMKRFISKLAFIDSIVKKKRGFQRKVWILAFMNLFRIVYSIFSPLANIFHIVDISKLELKIQNFCCERVQKWWFSLFIIVFSGLMTFTPLITIFSIFNNRNEQKQQQSIKSLLSQQSGISQN